jgi:hypothetical protein
VFEGSTADRIALTEVLLSPGGEKLSVEAAQLIAVLLGHMPDTEYEVEREFPRASPEGIAKSQHHLYQKVGSIERWLKVGVLALGLFNAALAAAAALIALLR